MAEVTYMTVTGQWSHIVDDGIVDGDPNPDVVHPTGKVIFAPKPSNTGFVTAGGAGESETTTLAEVPALIAAGVLTDLQGNPGVRLVMTVGGNPIRWVAQPTVMWEKKTLPSKSVTFDPPTVGSTLHLNDLFDDIGPQSPLVTSEVKAYRDQAIAARDATQQLVDEAAAGVVPDVGVAGHIAEPGSASRAAVDARVAAGTSGLLSQEDADNSYAPLWRASTVYAAGDLVMLPAPINGPGTRNSNGTSRESFDATEQGAWTATGGGLDPEIAESLYAPLPVAQAQRLLSKLDRGVESTTLLYISDSTGNEPWEHIYLEFAALAARFPAVTFIYRLVNPTTGVYDYAPITIQTGTGSAVCTLYNCAVSGSRPGFVLGAKWTNAVASVPDPDLILISHGHNLADPTSANGRQAVRAAYLSLTERLALAFPGSPLVLESQNPSARTGRETWQAIKASIVQQIAAQRGYGFIDVHQAFVAYQQATGKSVIDLQLDDGTQTHPNAEGSQVWANAVGKALVYRPTGLSLPQQTPPLAGPAESLLPDPLLTSWSGDTLAGWVAGNAVITKQTSHYLTGNAAMRITSNAADGTSYAEFQVNPATLGVWGDLTGQVITVAVHMYAPEANTGTPGVNVRDQTEATNQRQSDMDSTTRDGWVWVIVTKRMVTPATSLRIRIHSKSTGTSSSYVDVDAVHVSLGDLPRRTVAARSYVGGLPPAEPDSSVWSMVSSDGFSGDGPVNSPARTPDVAFGGDPTVYTVGSAADRFKTLGGKLTAGSAPAYQSIHQPIPGRNTRVLVKVDQKLTTITALTTWLLVCCARTGTAATGVTQIGVQVQQSASTQALVAKITVTDNAVPVTTLGASITIALGDEIGVSTQWNEAGTSCTVKLWLNGAVVDTMTYTGTIPQSWATMFVGHATDTTWEIDHFKVEQLVSS